MKERNIIHRYVLDNVDLEEIGDDMDIFEEGLVSSLFAIELMTFLEKNFEMKVTVEDLDMNNFKSINSILNFIEKKNMEVKNG